MAPRRKNRKLKKTIKYLTSCKHPEIISSIISKSPNNVIKSICDAALNAARGAVSLKPKENRILATNRQLIERLIEKGESAKRNRQILYHTGWSILGLVISIVLGAVLSTFAPKLFS